jgi:hypothetical protein
MTKTRDLADLGGGFIQAGSGAVQRTVESKLQDVVSVKDFGAVGDGVFNDYTAVAAAVATGQRVYFPKGTYLVNTTITLGDNQHILLDTEATISSGQSPVVQLTGSNSSLVGSGKTSTIYCTGASTKGVVLVGHTSTVDTGNVFYNQVSDLTIRGNDSFGATSALQSDYTMGLMLFSSETWSTSSAVYYNKFFNLKIQDVKEGILLAGVENANFFDGILFWRIGHTAFHFFAPHAADGEGDRYGYDWDTQTLNKTLAENVVSNVFVDTSGNAYVTEPGYASRTFSDGQTYPASATMLRFTGHSTFNQLTNFSGEPTNASQYIIGANTNDTYIQGGFNASAGTNNAPNEVTVLNSNTLVASSVSSRDTLTYKTGIWDNGTESVPTIYSRFDTDTGFYLPDNSTFAFTQSGAEKFRFTSEGICVGSKTPTAGYKFQSHGSIYINGDTRTKATYPIADNAYVLGTGSFRWSTVYAGTGTINTSDEREKQDIEALSDAELRVATSLKGLIKKFRFKDAIQAKGDAARIHVGVMTQEVIAAFQAEGLDPMRYGIVCYDQWDAELDDEGNEITPAGDRYGIRYEELLAFIIAAL